MSRVEVISSTTDPFLHLPIIEKEKVTTGYKYLGEIFTGKPLTDSIQEALKLAEVAVIEDPGWGYSYYRKELESEVIMADYEI